MQKVFALAFFYGKWRIFSSINPAQHLPVLEKVSSIILFHRSYPPLNFISSTYEPTDIESVIGKLLSNLTNLSHLETIWRSEWSWLLRLERTLFTNLSAAKEMNTINPLANPKGVKLLCELCQKPAFVQCTDCRVTYYW